MTNQEIFELMDHFERSSLTGMKLSVENPARGAAEGLAENFCIELTKGAGTGSAGAASGTAAGGAETLACVTGEAEALTAPEGLFITAPMVGTYYAASDPKQSPFVMPGDRVYKGQTVCLMEAMKMLSEIPAPCDCIIEEILKADGDLAAFGEPLFRYQPC